MTLLRVRWGWPIIGLALALWLGCMPVVGLAQGAAPAGPTGNYYVVQRGDTWASIAARNGRTVRELQAANPALKRPNDVLWVGDRVFIPQPGLPAAQPTAAAARGHWYTVKRGDSWQTVARDTGVPVLELWHANPGALYPNHWLYTGTQLWIPDRAGTAVSVPPTPRRAAAAATPTATGRTAPAAATSTPAPSATARAGSGFAPASSITATPTISLTATPSAQAGGAGSPAGTPSASASVTDTTTSGCPDGLAAYGDAIEVYLNSPDANPTGLGVWLTRCGVIRPDLGGVTVADIQRPGSHDIVAALADPVHGPTAPGRLLVYHALPNGYALSGVAEGQGQVEVLGIGDLNDNGATDIVWTDTVCNAGACVSTLFVDSWTGSSYESSLQDQPVTSDAVYGFQTLPGASGLAIVITGTVAGPPTVVPAPLPQATAPAGEATARPGLQAPAGTASRTSTEVYVSENGGPYHRLGDSLATSLPAGAATPPVTPAPSPTPAATGAPTLAVAATPAPTSTALATVTPAPAATIASAVQPQSTLQPAAPPTALPAATVGVAATRAPAAAAQGDCLADQVRAANQVFDNWSRAGFDPARQAYQAISAATASPCGLSADQVAQWTDFARFRLLVAGFASGQVVQGEALRDQMQMPEFHAAADAFLASFADSHSLVQACRDTTSYAQSHPETWQFVAQPGSSFAADDLCPLAK